MLTAKSSFPGIPRVLPVRRRWTCSYGFTSATRGGDPWFAKAVTWEHYEPRIIQVGIAYWLIILGFLLPWSAWLFVHGKRERRKKGAL